MRVVAAVVAGAAFASLAAVTLGEYSLAGAIPWLAAAIVPGIMGVMMVAIAGRHRRAMWVVTGALSLGALTWGVRIASGWGLDPVPAAAWAEIVIGTAWPLGWALASGRKLQPSG